MAHPTDNPRPLGAIKDIFRRQYIYFNPDRLTGPDTWRLNLPAEVRCGEGNVCTSETTLKTIAPITHIKQGRDYDLLFTIGACPDLPVKFSSQRRRGILVIPPGMSRASGHCDIDSLTAFPPLFGTTSGSTVNLKFDLDPLQELPSIRTNNYQLSYTNSRSVDTITAEKPVEANTVGLETTVSFDIESLTPLP